MPTELHRDAVVLLRDVVALAHIVERVKLHHEMMHAAVAPLGNGEAVMAAVDVHEIERHRWAHEVSDPESQQVPIEGQGRVDVWHDQHGMSQALRAGAEPPCMPCRAEWFIGDLTTVESLHTVTGRI